jgi:hypothetical protein
MLNIKNIIPNYYVENFFFMRGNLSILLDLNYLTWKKISNDYM